MKNLRKVVLGLGLAGVLGISSVYAPVYLDSNRVSAAEKDSYDFYTNVDGNWCRLGVGENKQIGGFPEYVDGKVEYEVFDSKGKKADGVSVWGGKNYFMIKGEKVGKYKIKFKNKNGKSALRYKGKALKYYAVEVKKAPEYVSCVVDFFVIKVGKKLELPICFNKGASSRIFVKSIKGPVKYLGNKTVVGTGEGNATIVFSTYNHKTVKIKFKVVK